MSIPPYADKIFQPSSTSTCEAIRENIQLISRMEEKYLRGRSLGGRMADAIGSFSGSMTFVAIHLVWFAGWIIYNAFVPGIHPFDPFPFMLLSMIVSLEAILLSTFVLMKQNRMSKRADSRAHLDLQINLLSEKEMTMVLQMLELIGERVGVKNTHLQAELKELSGTTPVEVLAEQIEEHINKEE